MTDQWISVDEAADLAGCSHGTVATAARNGEVTQRKLSRGQPSLDRDSVLAWAEQRRERLEQQAQRRAERQHQQQELGRRPDLEHIWLNQKDAAEVLGVSKTWVRRLAREDRLPFSEVDGRRWFREDHLRRVLVARELERDDRMRQV